LRAVALTLLLCVEHASAEAPDPAASAAAQDLTGKDVDRVYGITAPEQPTPQVDRGDSPSVRDSGVPADAAVSDGEVAKSELAERHVAELMASYDEQRPFDSAGFMIHDNNYFSILSAGDDAAVKFQISVRYELLTLGYVRGYSWSFAYTQKALWDLLNFDDSAPFVENNYRPETFFSFRPKRERYTEEYSLGVAHESNGLGLTENGDLKQASKSWNHVYLSAKRHLTPVLGIGRFRFQVVAALRGWLPFGVSAGEFPPELERIERASARRMQKNISYAALTFDVRFGSSWLYRNQTLAHESRGLLRVLAKPRSAETSLYIPLPLKGWIQAALYAQLFVGKVEYLMLYDRRTTNFYLGVGLL
jgi:hypothetical protein